MTKIPDDNLKDLDADAAPEGQDGDIDTLNVDLGHAKLNFNSQVPEEVERARQMVQDALKRGCMVFILVDGQEQRVESFDATKDEYLIGPIDPATQEKKRVKAKETKATAVAPTSGG